MSRLDKIVQLQKRAEIYGKLAVVWAGSKTPPDDFIKFWQEGNYRAGHPSGAGQARGPGLYTVYNKIGSPTEDGGYGKYIYKFVVNLDNYLILVDEEIGKVYPELRHLDYKEKVLRQLDRFDIDREIISGMLKGGLVPHVTSDLASVIQDAGLHYGIVYRGSGDGDCCLIQIPEKAKLIGYENDGREVSFEKDELKRINKNYKRLSHEPRSLREKLLEYSKKYPAKAISIVRSKWEDILEKNESSNTIFYFNIELESAKNLAQLDYESFRDLNLHNTHPNLLEQAEKSLAKTNPAKFFKLSLGEKYPEIGRSAAEELVSHSPSQFFGFRLQEKYPEIGRSSAERLVKNNPQKFFAQHLHKTYPEVGRAAAEEFANASNPNSFFSYHMNDIYPELGRLAAINYLEKKPIQYFKRYIDTLYPDLEEAAARSLANKHPEMFFQYGFNKTYPNIEANMTIDKLSKLIRWLKKSGFKKEASEIIGII